MLNMGRNFCFVNISVKSGSRDLKKILHMHLMKANPHEKFRDDLDHDPDQKIQKLPKIRHFKKSYNSKSTPQNFIKFGL